MVTETRTYASLQQQKLLIKFKREGTLGKYRLPKDLLISSRLAKELGYGVSEEDVKAGKGFLLPTIEPEKGETYGRIRPPTPAVAEPPPIRPVIPPKVVRPTVPPEPVKVPIEPELLPDLSVLQRVYPELFDIEITAEVGIPETIDQALGSIQIWANEAPGDFIEDLQAKGRSRDTEAVLSMLGADDTLISEILGYFKGLPMKQLKTDRDRAELLERGGVPEAEIAKILSLSKLDLGAEGWLDKFKSINPSFRKDLSYGVLSRSIASGLGGIVAAGGGLAGWAKQEGVRQNFLEVAEVLQSSSPEMVSWTGVETLWDPRFWQTTVASTLTFSVALVPPAILMAYAAVPTAAAVGIGAFGTTIMALFFGATGSALLEAGFESGSVWNEAKNMGFTDDEASEAAGSVYWKNALTLGVMRIPEFAFAFGINPFGTVVKSMILKRLVKIGRFGVPALTEGGQELAQDIYTRQALGIPIEWDDEAKLAVVLGAILGITLGAGGNAFTMIQERVKGRLTPELQSIFDAEKETTLAEGLTEEGADLRALDAVSDTPEGKTLIEDIAEEIKEAELGRVIQPEDKVEGLAWEHLRQQRRVPEVTPPVEEVIIEEVTPTNWKRALTEADEAMVALETGQVRPDLTVDTREYQDFVDSEITRIAQKHGVPEIILRKQTLWEPSPAEVEVRIPLTKAEIDELVAGVTVKPEPPAVITPEAPPTPVTEPVVTPEVLDKAGSPIEGLRGQPIELNPDGTITLFHRTTPEMAERIRQTGRFQTPTPAEEVFFSNFREGQATGYGEAIIEIRIKPENVTLDDAFPSGEVHVSAIPQDIISKGIIAKPPAVVPEPVEVPVEPVEEIPPPKPAPPVVPVVEERVQKELAIQKTKQDTFVETTEKENISKAGDEALNAQSEAAGLPPPNIPPGTTGHIGHGGKNPENSIYDMTNRVIPGEDAGRAALRLWDGTRNRMATETIGWWRKGNKTLKDLGIGKTDGRNQRLTKEDSLELFKALHGEADVPANLQSIYDELKTLLDQEASDMLAFDPTFSRVLMAHPDYFPRGWRPPREPTRLRLGVRPGFLKPRVDATFTEMIDGGWEPISWNPYDMAALRRMAGTEYREGQILISRLKTFSKAIAENDAPRKGWRVPKVGPAFEGKPYVGSDGKAYMTPKVSVPNNVADVLESIYGVPVEFRVLGVNIWKAISGFGQITKRAKLFMSLFQHVDFLTRDWMIAFTPEGIRRGLPLKFPALAARVTASAVSPGVRGNLERRILSGESLYVDSDITLKMVADKGWKLGQDELLIRRDVREQLEAIVKEAQEEGLKVRWFQRAGQGIVKVTDPVTRRLGTVARFFEAGLFDGVYRESQAYALEHVIIPRLRRLHPDWTTEQIAGSAAEEVNKQFSTLGVWQSAVQQPATREFVRTMFFSWNESESWIRQATSTVVGQNKRYWQEYTIAMFIALAVAANAINMLSEGDPLPPDRYVPFQLGSPYSSMPWGIAYNDKFLSPRLPWDGRNGQPIYLDIVGQADTWLRWLLDPAGALTARVNVLPRALINQVQGEDFWGRELKDWDDRVKQAVLDLFAPIGAGNLLEVARLQWPEVAEVLPEAEARIGIVGSLIQATGLNVRSMKTRAMLDKFARESGLKKADGTPVKTWGDLEPSQRRKLEKNETLQRELGLRSVTAVERQYPGAEGFAKLDKIDQERITRGEALVAELVSDLLEVDRPEMFDTARGFRREVSRLKKEIADRKAQVDEDYQLFKDTGELPEEPNKRALVEYYNIFEKGLRPSGVMDWDKVNELEIALRDSWTPTQQAYVDRNIALTEWGPLMQEFVDAQRVLGDSGYWDVSEIDRRVFRFEHSEIEDILTGKFYNYKPIEEEAEKIGLKWQDVYRQVDAMEDKYKEMSDAEVNRIPALEGIEDWAEMTPAKKRDLLLDIGKESLYNENPGFWEDDRRKKAWSAVGDLLDEKKSLVFVSEFVEYSNIAREFGANSSEARLYRFDSKELDALGTQGGVFGWGGLEEDMVPRWRIDVQMAKLDEDSEEFETLKRRKEAFTKGLTGDLVSRFVEYWEFPVKGYQQERYLIDHPELAEALGLDIPTRVPAEEIDALLLIENPTAEDKRRIDAYRKFVPNQYIDNYVEYYSLEKPEGVDLWYDDDWFLMEHLEFYKTLRDMVIIPKADFRLVPSREVFKKYQVYQDKIPGKRRDDYRFENLDLDAWLVLKFDYVPIKEKERRAELTPTERFKEEIEKARRGSE